MAIKYSWFKFYWERFLLGTAKMRDSEVGRYLRLLLDQFDKGGLTDADFVGVSPRVREKFQQKPDGLYYNALMEEVWIEQQNSKAKAKESGLKGAEARWGKVKEPIATLQPIDSHKTDKKRVEENTPPLGALYIQYINLINTLLKKEYRGDKKSKGQFAARIKDGYTIEQFTQAITAGSKDPYHIEQAYRYLTPEFFSRADKLEKFLNHGAIKAEIKSHENRGYTDDQLINLQVKPEDYAWALDVRTTLIRNRDQGK